MMAYKQTPSRASTYAYFDSGLVRLEHEPVKFGHNGKEGQELQIHSGSILKRIQSSYRSINP